MQLSFNGLAFIKANEGFKKKAYQDGGGVWTIGYGTTFIDGKPVEAGLTCTEPEASLWLATDSAAAQTAVNQSVKVPITQNMFDALVDFVYNLGVGNFQKSTLLKLLNMKLYKEAALEFPKWNKDNGKPVPGLTSRRLREQSMFTT